MTAFKATSIVYVRAATGHAVPVLGLVDVATNLRQATCLETKSSDKTFEAIVKPYGLPVSGVPGQLEAMGILVEFCATGALANSTWNGAAVLRALLEKMVDSHAAATIRDLEGLLAPTLRALSRTCLLTQCHWPPCLEILQLKPNKYVQKPCNTSPTLS